MRTTPTYFQRADGISYIFVSGKTKQSECSRVPVSPGLARLRIVTSPGQPAYLSIDASDSVPNLFSPGPPVITSNGSDNAIVWVLDANVYRSASLVGSNVPRPVLYALDANTMQLLWNSTSNQLNVGVSTTTPIIAHGIVLVGTDRIQAFGMNSSPGGSQAEGRNKRDYWGEYQAAGSRRDERELVLPALAKVQNGVFWLALALTNME